MQYADVNLRVPEVRVPEPALKHGRHNAAVQEMHGIAVPERVRGRVRQRKRQPLPGDPAHRIAQPVPRRIVRDRPAAASFPDRPAAVGAEGGEVVAQSHHKTRIEQGHTPLRAGRRLTGSGIALPLERHEPDVRADAVQHDIIRPDGQRLVDAGPGVPDKLKQHPPVQVRNGREQDRHLRRQQVAGQAVVTGQLAPHGERQPVVDDRGDGAV